MNALFQKKITRWLMLLLVFSLLLPQSGQWAVLPVSATMTQAQIDALQDEADELAEELKRLESELAATAADKSAALTQKGNLEKQINLYQAELNNISAQIDQYAILITQKEADVANAQANEAAQYALFCQRVRAMEEGGEVNYWSILFSATDFSDLLDRFNMVEELMAYDNGVMDQLVVMRNELEIQQADLEASKLEQESVFAQQQEAQNALIAKEAEVSTLIQSIAKDQAQLEAAEDALSKAAQAMDEKIAAAEEELRKQLEAAGNPIVSEAGFIWPLPTNYNALSSLFGSRTHPITGKPNNHSGIDLPAAGGTNIFATKSGVVSVAGYDSSYGNYCVITHADGQSTLYAHQRVLPIVKVGDSVTQGQVIGYVGTTGSSTGNHLHYEIRENGVRVDPVNYYPEFTLYVYYSGQKVELDL